MIENILIFFIAFVLGFYLVVLLLTLWVRYRLRRVHNELGQVLGKIVHEAIKEQTIIMRIEHDPEHGYFAYRVIDGEFLAHGPTMEDMQKNFAERFPGKTGLVPDQEDSGADFVKAARLEG